MSQPTRANAVAILPDNGRIVAGGAIEAFHRTLAAPGLEPGFGQIVAPYFDFLRAGEAFAVAADGAGGSVVAGLVKQADSGDDFAVVKVDAFGLPVWQQDLDGAVPCGDRAVAVAVDPAGDVVAAGMLGVNGPGDSLAVVKFRGSDGVILWQRTLGAGSASALVLAPGGHPVVAGVLAGHFAVAELDAASGDTQWTYDGGVGAATALAGVGGDVVAVGTLAGSCGGPPCGIVRIAGTGAAVTPGTARWLHAFLPTATAVGGPTAVTTTPGETVVVAGTSRDPLDHMHVVSLDVGSGGLVWSVEPGAGTLAAIAARSGDVVVAGTAPGASPGVHTDFAVLRLGSAGGGTVWSRGIDGGAHHDDEARAVGVDAAGDVVAAGALAVGSVDFSFPPAFAVVKLRGDTGEDYEATCGNGTLDPGEECDDGNINAGDCCSPTCTAEPAHQPCGGDGNDCTIDECDDAGACVHTPSSGGSCNDGNDCTVGDTCVAGQCVGGSVLDAGTACADDGNECTSDVCDGNGTCTHPPLTGASCDDSNPCTVSDTCQAGACVGTVPATPPACDDGNPCTSGDVCLGLFCMPGAPAAPGTTCFSDGNECTDDVCDASGICRHVNNTAPCDDGDMCTTGDVCRDGVCAGTPGGGTTTTTTVTSTTTTTTSPTTSTTTSTTSTSTTSSTTTTTVPTTSTTVPTTSTTTSTTGTTVPTTSTTTTTSPTSTTTTSSTTTTTTSSTTTTTTSSTSTTAPTTSTTAVTTTSSSSTSTTRPEATTTTTAPTTSTTTTTLPTACSSDAECSDGDVCDGVEACRAGACVSAATAAADCTPGARLAAVTQYRRDAVTLVEVASRTVLGEIAVSHAPWGVAWAPDGSRVWVTGRGGDHVDEIDPVARTVVRSVAVAAEPLGIAVEPSGARLWVASYGGGVVTVLDTATLAVVDTVKIDDGAAGIAVHPAGTHVYATSYRAGRVSEIDPATHAVTRTTAVGGLPLGIAVHPDGSKLYVTGFRGRTVTVLGTAAFAPTRVVRVGRAPVGVAFAGDGRRAYVASAGDDVLTVLDAAADRVTQRLSVAGHPIGVAADPDGGGVWVAASRAGHLGVFADDGTAAGGVDVPGTPVAFGAFIGGSRGDCPAMALGCDDGDPFTRDACDAQRGCAHTPTDGIEGVQSGVAWVAARVADGSLGDGAVVDELRAALPVLQGAVTGLSSGDRNASRKLLRQRLGRLLAAVRRASRRGDLGSAGGTLLDVVRETRLRVARLR